MTDDINSNDSYENNDESFKELKDLLKKQNEKIDEYQNRILLLESRKSLENDNVKNNKTRTTFFSILVIYLGLFVGISPILNISIYNLILSYYPSVIGIIAAFCAGYYYLGKVRTKVKDVNFVDVDNKYSEIVNNQSKIDKIVNLEQRLKSFTLDGQPNSLCAKSAEQDVDFVGYFNKIINLLQNKADAADEKASILLQRGIAYTKFGIVYYLISIISWQIVFWRSGFKHEFVWGIASCSFLFLFIEFLSAWFLKQYKNFTDNSVYLMKIKSIFDRYLLVYTVSREKDEGDSYEKNSELLKFLVRDISWPDVKVIESKESTFAKEALSSLAEILQAIKLKDKVES
ncbi:hypothetical protein BJ925_2618 [Rahnella aquatilis]|nr:hypothetical protein BJ925_2618 [Rahnella aquatilis]